MHSPRVLITLTIVVVIGAVLYALPSRVRSERTAAASTPPQTTCPSAHRFVDFRAATNPRARDEQRHALKRALEERDNTTVRLGPDVDVDFFADDLPALPENFFPITFNRCVTLTSVSHFVDEPRDPDLVAQVTEARTPKSLGPVLRFSKHRADAKVFLDIHCWADGAVNDGARISGFRLYGPDFGQQETSEIGIRIVRCVDIKIWNMEIAGWGSAAIAILDDPGPDIPPGASGPGGRISNPDQVVIRDSFIHHNQYPKEGFPHGFAAGYGVDVGVGAWAAIMRNVFDSNRHSIAASGTTGGYAAKQNLVLKGGGFHGGFGNTFTHSFDVHGTGGNGMGGDAGQQFWFIGNAFQYRKDYAVKLRGKPALNAYFTENIFPHPGLEADEGDDAIYLTTTTNVTLGAGNEVAFDSFGKYGVCDFDGDNIDDLFLATGSTWWYSSFGEFPWSYLGDKNERPDEVRLGYFDGDLRCDVLTEKNGLWLISSGGTGDWQRLGPGSFDAPIGEVHFGRFDPSQRDPRPGATRQTTHALHRRMNGEWWVTPLSTKDWELVQSSSTPMEKLRFGDFNGDGVTDVLSVANGRWAISDAARSQWQRLNQNLAHPVADLFIANMDAADNIDDILRLVVNTTPRPFNKTLVRLVWWRSRNGVERWRHWKTHTFEYTPVLDILAGPGFVGRFGAAPGGGTLSIDANRLGHFFSQADIAKPEWTSLYSY